MADLIFILFGFTCFAYVELATALLVWSNPIQSNRRPSVQLYFPLWCSVLSFDLSWLDKNLEWKVARDRQRPTESRCCLEVIESVVVMLLTVKQSSRARFHIGRKCVNLNLN